MTLEEAIKHAEGVAEEKEKDMQHRKFILNQLDTHNNRVHYDKACECAEEHRQFAEWLKELEQLRAQTRWIPVSERLPGCCGMYIVTRKIYDCPDTAPIIMSDESWFDGQNTWHNDNRINHERGYFSDVIAWMPLPKPYEPQESEETE